MKVDSTNMSIAQMIDFNRLVREISAIGSALAIDKSMSDVTSSNLSQEDKDYVIGLNNRVSELRELQKALIDSESVDPKKFSVQIENFQKREKARLEKFGTKDPAVALDKEIDEIRERTMSLFLKLFFGTYANITALLEKMSDTVQQISGGKLDTENGLKKVLEIQKEVNILNQETERRMAVVNAGMRKAA
jgi:hypothetical protein